jgi:hypothetical protein
MSWSRKKNPSHVAHLEIPTGPTFSSAYQVRPHELTTEPYRDVIDTLLNLGEVADQKVTLAT